MLVGTTSIGLFALTKQEAVIKCQNYCKNNLDGTPRNPYLICKDGTKLYCWGNLTEETEQEFTCKCNNPALKCQFKGGETGGKKSCPQTVKIKSLPF